MTKRRIALSVRGMHCASCTQLVARALNRVPGATCTKVDLLDGLALVDVEQDSATEDVLKEAVRGAGFQVPD